MPEFHVTPPRVILPDVAVDNVVLVLTTNGPLNVNEPDVAAILPFGVNVELDVVKKLIPLLSVKLFAA